MVKYLLKRLLHGLISVVIVVAIVMLLIYSFMDKNNVFMQDGQFSKLKSNERTIYKYQQWERFGYLDYVPYSDYLSELVKNDEIDDETAKSAAAIARQSSGDSELVAKYVEQFTQYYEARNYTVVRLDAVVYKNTVITGGRQSLFAYKDIPVFVRMWTYFTGLIEFDNIHYASGDVGDRGISFTLFDPAYGGNVFSPAIIGNGTRHKYLLYFDNQFPFIHQNLVSIHLGTSYSLNTGVDVYDTMTNSQGGLVQQERVYPTGIVYNSSDDLHSAVYIEGSRINGGELIMSQFNDDYTGVSAVKASKSTIAFSFVIGVIAVIFAYLIAIPLGITMARKKDKLADKLGMIYIIFIIAVPSLAYILIFRAIGGAVFNLPKDFDITHETIFMYILPIVSLALPSIANLMKWLRRFMIDQENSDYVKFARSGGFSESEIFKKHILKNAIIPITHGIPGSILGALVGAIMTERIYRVPGTGQLLTLAINAYDNGVIVGVTMFYALLSIISIILGDLLMAMVDPRISYTTKGR
ncbi:MAG: ABC transporter permease [Clostridia bacterium]|nr:ABC transporter permease [Clostridia bacterium]